MMSVAQTQILLGSHLSTLQGPMLPGFMGANTGRARQWEVSGPKQEHN